ncbi:MAG: histidine--tRNA ligase [Dehalococcoidia bacterium]|nr:histidine--tRNA ligase [Dehalococcoidia bacterium]
MPTAPRGTSDRLPEEQPSWEHVISTAEEVCRLYGYQRIDTPVFEDAGVYLRTTGDSTDVVRKEMYIFEDRGGEKLALRPEGTAGVCRAYLEHGMSNLVQPVRLFYIAPVFRYDRPQAGRYRQHHQFGVEALGDADPALDAEVIDLLHTFYRRLGLDDFRLQLNSIGDVMCRPAYLERLRAYYADKLDLLDRDCRERLENNPLRLLDCKNAGCQPIIDAAPVLVDHLCEPCRDHFATVRRCLERLGVSHDLNPRLVRGLDYYTRTVFEFQPLVEGSQSALGGGGRYDGLIELLGGKPTPGVGFGTGIERIILNLKRTEVAVPGGASPELFVAHMGDGTIEAALDILMRARGEGISALMATGGRSLKAQMRQADSSGARYVALIGERELESGEVTLRDLTTRSQESLPVADAISRLTAS